MLASTIAQYTLFLVISDMRTALSPLNINQKTKQRYMLYDNVICYNVIYVASISAHVFDF